MPEGISSDELSSSRNKTLLKISIMIILIVAAIISIGYIQKAVLKINPDSNSCIGGLCRYACDDSKEVQRVSAQCSDNTKKCCVPKDYAASPECSGKDSGDRCGNTKFCDDTLECISKCAYCAKNPEDERCIVSSSEQSGRHVDTLDSRFSCSCSETDCIGYDDGMLGTCVKNICPDETTGKICCDAP